MKLELKDSQYIKGEKKKDRYNIAIYCQAVNILNKDIKEKRVDFFSLSNNQEIQFLEETLIWYDINETRGDKSKVVNKATFYTSHYIGFYSTKIDDRQINIIIKPRFGDGIFNYLISYAYRVYLPKGSSGTSNKNSDTLWLIAMMWKATLQKAMTKSQIPKEYQKFEKNLSTYKGQLNISKHIKHNLFDKSKFYCNYRKLTMNTTINQTIRYTYKLLEKKGFGNLLKDIAEYDQMLQSFGVESKVIHQKEIQNIRYSKLNIYYKKVMELSSLILKSQSKSSDSTSSNNDSFSYFLDIAELWENYLLKVLQRNLPEYDIYSPNEKGGISLFNDGSREIRPDIIIKKNGEVVAVLDAKYKWYNQIGRYADYDNAISRDDLYQMSTYIYHYGKGDKKLIGLFVSPMGQRHKYKDGDLKLLKNNLNHQIGIINLNIAKFKNKEKIDTQIINKEEERFISNIKKALEEDNI
jgi:5-methylcytosine-specific restriction endonuclease McrBC regulatory subunit McrC